MKLSTLETPGTLQRGGDICTKPRRTEFVRLKSRGAEARDNLTVERTPYAKTETHKIHLGTLSPPPGGRRFCRKGRHGPLQHVPCGQNCPWLRTTGLGKFFFLLSILVENLGTQGYVWGLWLLGGAPWSGKMCTAFKRHPGAQQRIQESWFPAMRKTPGPTLVLGRPEPWALRSQHGTRQVLFLEGEPGFGPPAK